MTTIIKESTRRQDQLMCRWPKARTRMPVNVSVQPSNPPDFTTKSTHVLRSYTTRSPGTFLHSELLPRPLLILISTIRQERTPGKITGIAVLFPIIQVFIVLCWRQRLPTSKHKLPSSDIQVRRKRQPTLG